MPSCCVPDCWNNNEKQERHHLSWFRFSLGQNQKVCSVNGWLALAAPISFLSTSASSVCSAHFEENSFQVDLVGQLLPEQREGKIARRLKADAVPTLLAHSQQSALSDDKEDSKLTHDRSASIYLRKKNIIKPKRCVSSWYAKRACCKLIFSLIIRKFSYLTFFFGPASLFTFSRTIFLPCPWLASPRTSLIQCLLFLLSSQFFHFSFTVWSPEGA